MRKSPKESATIFKVGTRKEGLDGYYYYVLTDKNKRKRWVKEGCLFVIYKINPTTKKNHWTYGKFPGNWQLVGSGTVVSIQMLSDTVKYPREEQFTGNPKYTTKIKKKLRQLFKKLKQKEIIKHYKIVSLKGLQNYMKKLKIS
tara:strand:+ start:38 stop:466 length:429 start_codon:yes stop_codon:yes gene_type:complete